MFCQQVKCGTLLRAQASHVQWYLSHENFLTLHVRLTLAEHPAWITGSRPVEALATIRKWRCTAVLYNLVLRNSLSTSICLDGKRTFPCMTVWPHGCNSIKFWSTQTRSSIIQSSSHEYRTSYAPSWFTNKTKDKRKWAHTSDKYVEKSDIRKR